MKTPESSYPPPDLDEALKTFDRLQLEGGDLGARYWEKIAELVKEADYYRVRSLSAEMKLERIRALASYR
ncbi:hypothetical protein [Herbaspirillum rubrisubalbicans]|uniref:Uncharacterized protein n=1 Tax=Herbaspirillum rubrisubalbicans TaxID=80842 RepID=A0AAD0U5E7_9BURK|nr:hypothetical protein [Herbaspirillum rubrisubalbicans]AYR23370.1 hypothetical protein RC54_05820 [Herbaspirillum rubrisubalbicans]